MRLIDADALKKQIEDFHCKDCDNYNFVRCRACWVDDTITYLEEAPTIGGWISATDKQPDLEDQVLIAYEWTGRSGAKYREIALDSFKAMGFLGYKPLFWMPLPELPKEVSEDE